MAYMYNVFMDNFKNRLGNCHITLLL